MFKYQQVSGGSSVKNAGALTIPAGTNKVKLQADTAVVRYTLDGTTTPSSSVGMLLEPPGAGVANNEIEILVDDLMLLQFYTSGNLNIHYYGSHASSDFVRSTYGQPVAKTLNPAVTG